MAAPSPTATDKLIVHEVDKLNPAICMSITGLEEAFKKYHGLGGEPGEAFVIAGHEAAIQANEFMNAGIDQAPDFRRVVRMPNLLPEQWALVGPHGVVLGWWIYD